MKIKLFTVLLLAFCLFSGLSSSAQDKQDGKAVKGATVKTTDQEKQELKDILVRIGILQNQLESLGLKLENSKLKLQLKYNCKECDLTQDLDLIPAETKPFK